MKAEVGSVGYNGRQTQQLLEIVTLLEAVSKGNPGSSQFTVVTHGNMEETATSQSQHTHRRERSVYSSAGSLGNVWRHTVWMTVSMYHRLHGIPTNYVHVGWAVRAHGEGNPPIVMLTPAGGTSVMLYGSSRVIFSPVTGVAKYWISPTAQGLKLILHTARLLSLGMRRAKEQQVAKSALPAHRSLKECKILLHGGGHILRRGKSLVITFSPPTSPLWLTHSARGEETQTSFST